MIEKTSFRDQVRKLITKKMREGNIQPQQTISLASLGRELDVSVTPIREALTQLQTIGIVEAIPNKGFYIPELSSEEAKNLYELVANLECMAITQSSYSAKDIAKLRRYNEKFKKAKTNIERINADIDFHDLLTSNYNNDIALKLLDDLKLRIFFYEFEFMSKDNLYGDSDNQHELLIQQLENNEMDKACEILKHNWLNVLDHLEPVDS